MQFQMNPIAISKSGKIFPEAENKRKKKNSLKVGRAI